MPEPEWAFWMNDTNMGPAQGAVKRYFLNARRIFKDIAGEVRRSLPARRSRRELFRCLPMATRPATQLSPSIQVINRCSR